MLLELIKSVRHKKHSFLVLKVPRRYVYSLLTVISIKILSSLFIYYYLGLGYSKSYWMDSSRVENLTQNLVLTMNFEKYPRFAYLFLGWDGAWYLSILYYGYSFSNQSFAFFPGLVFTASALNIFLKSPLFSILLITIFSGIILVPVFQSILESYMDQTKAYYFTLLYVSSPYVFIFSTLVYAEGLYLFLTLLSWKLCLNSRYSLAAIFASFSAFIRPQGVILALPIFLKSVKCFDIEEIFGKLYLLIIPIIGYFASWMNAWIVSGDMFGIVRVNEWSEMYTTLNFILKILPSYGLNAFTQLDQSLNIHILLPFFIFLSLFFTPVIIVRLFKLDRELAIYSLTYYFAAISLGAALSLPRYLFFLFPLGIGLPLLKVFNGKCRSPLFISVSMFFSIILWLGFLNGFFIG